MRDREREREWLPKLQAGRSVDNFLNLIFSPVKLCSWTFPSVGQNLTFQPGRSIASILVVAFGSSSQVKKVLPPIGSSSNQVCQKRMFITTYRQHVCSINMELCEN